MKIKLLLLSILLTSCAIEPLTNTAIGNTVSSIKTVTRDIASKAVPTFPVEVPRIMKHYTSTGQTFINQIIGPFEHNISPEGLSIRVSNLDVIPTYSNVLVLEGFGDWEKGDPQIILEPVHARIIVWEENFKNINPTVQVGDETIPFIKIDGGWKIFLLPGTYYFEVDNLAKLITTGEAGKETVFYKEASASGEVSIAEGAFTERTLIRTE